MGRLSGRVAVVTGATRGAGRGIAEELGAEGATVYVTGRSTRAGWPDAYRPIVQATGMSAMPGTIEDAAEAVDRAGGVGIPVRCDHTRPEEVRALFDRVDREHGRLDLLVNNAWGGHEAFSTESFGRPFWEQPLDQWEAMFDRGVRNHLVAAQAAARLLVRSRGLVVATTFWDRDRYLKGNLLYDLAKAAMNRLAYGIAEELRPHGVTSVAVSPGFMRTELVLAAHGAIEDGAVGPLSRTESPRYLGRAVAALLADPAVFEKTGRVLLVADLARAYGFTDVDGRQPPAFELH